MLRKVVSYFPSDWQHSARKYLLRQQIRRGTFPTRKVSRQELRRWLREGDWVIDVGANVGHYTARFAETVGKTGRVIAIEPVLETFEILAYCMSQLPQNNTTLLNIAASDGSTVSGMVMPKFDSGLKNSWRARISASGAMVGLSTLCLPIDALQLPHRIALVKIDAEGHDRAVLKGMAELLKKDRPVVVIESKTAEVSLFLRDLGYALTPEKMYNDLVFCSY